VLIIECMPVGCFLAFGGGFGWGHGYYINRTIHLGCFRVRAGAG
jgi:hypothetical protein